MSRQSVFGSPLFLGFDHLEQMLERVTKNADGYPPYNIEQIGPDRLRITLDDRGRIASFYDKQAERQLLPAGEVGNRLVAYRDMPPAFDAWDIDRSDWRSFRVDRIERARTTGDSFVPRPVTADVATRLERGIAYEGAQDDEVAGFWQKVEHGRPEQHCHQLEEGARHHDGDEGRQAS